MTPLPALTMCVAALGLTVTACAQPSAYDRTYGWNSQSGPQYHPRYYQAGYDQRQFHDYDHLCRQRSARDQNVAIGAVLGAVVGGVAANDDDALVGALIGAGLGALLGSQINRGFDDCDRTQFGYAAKTSFEQNQPVYWRSPRSDARGVIHPGSYYSQRGQQCRRGHAEVYMPDGAYQRTQIRMCRDRNGQWRLADNQR